MWLIEYDQLAKDSIGMGKNQPPSTTKSTQSF
jgi:hypothetical protein